MDTASIVGLLKESIFPILVFAVVLLYAMARGRQSVINLILSLYFALLISLKFPYFDLVLTSESQSTNASIMIAIFALFTIGGLFLFGRLIPNDDYDTGFQGFGKKILFALMATILVMAYSYHAIPVTDIITPGSPMQSLFAPEDRFFWWLILPLIGLFVL